MERTRIRRPDGVSENGDIILPKSLREIFYKLQGGVDALQLYIFYLHTAYWQKTNRPKATEIFCMGGLGWGKERMQRAKEILEKLGLVELIQSRNVNGKWDKGYVKINRISAVNGDSIRQAVPMLSDHSRSTWPQASNPAGGSDAINAKGFKAIRNAVEESKSPLQEKKRKSKITVTPLPWNDPPPYIIDDGDIYERHTDEEINRRYLWNQDGYLRKLSGSMLEWHKKKGHWKEPDE